MVKRMLGLCSALALLSVLAASTILAGDGEAPPVPEAAAAEAQELEITPAMLELPLEPLTPVFEAGACGPECTSHEECNGFCGPSGLCSFEKRCKGRCLCAY